MLTHSMQKKLRLEILLERVQVRGGQDGLVPLEQEIVGPEQDAPAEKTACGFAAVQLPIVYEDGALAAVLEG